MSHDADLVVAGAGAGGLSVLWHVLHDGPALDRIVVVDRDLEPGDDRTWAFWSRTDAPAPFVDLADRSWDDLLVRFPDWELRHRLVGRRYHRVRRRAFDTAVLAAAEAAPNVELVRADITSIDDEPSTGVVRTTAGDLRAPVVTQSVRLPPGAADATVRHPLRQHFGGWEVRTEHPVFEPGIATFMDFDTDQHDGVAFFYVLPDAVDRALVEHTVFSPTPRPAAFYDDHLAGHLAARGAGDVVVERHEHGIIPMEDRRLAQRWGRHVWNVGAVGGRIKPTTGYAFQRIHAQAAHLARTWRETGSPQPLPDPPWRFAANDRLLLHVLHREPAQGRRVFEALFRSTPLDDVLTFLDEESRLASDLALMARMPWSPFLRAVAAEGWAGLAGRLSRR